MSFAHLHVHSQYSFLEATIHIKELAEEAQKMELPAVALTDYGNLCGAPEFYQAMQKVGVKPILGCEFYVVDGNHANRGLDMHGRRPTLYHLPLLAKNAAGWRNLMQMSSKGYLDGFYHKPRVDFKLLEEHKEGLICLSGSPLSHVNRLLAMGKEDDARKSVLRFREWYGDDFYLELMDHGLEDEATYNAFHIEIGKELGIPLVASNHVHYLKQEHSEAHDILRCIGMRTDLNNPSRPRLPNDKYYFKSPEEMKELFSALPEAISNTLEIADKVEFELKFGEKHFPKFQIPKDVDAADDFEYLRQLSEEGLPKRYADVTDELYQRMEFELNIIQMKHLASYFLIVRDFIVFANEREIPVGPGRGSAAGSLVSYLIGITNIDPMEYNLLFERFINPERESYPDIDVDFSDDRRGEVIEYVRKKYGADCVSQIITYGRMLAKGVVRDVGRVMGLPLEEVNAIAKLIPDPVQGKSKKLYEAIKDVPELKELIESRGEYKQLMERALTLEGTVRNQGVHAAGVIITPEPITNFAPLSRAGEEGVVVQFDMNNAEALGMLKVDFLGLKTLSILDKTLALIRNKGVELDLDDIPIDDKPTYELFSRGDTIGIFQFESSGMRENLRKLLPERLEDLIAMNALYRPGPMANIDDFINCKQGRQEVKYLHPTLAPILDETYGIIVYQEQVMQIANQIGGMSLGRADVLRRAMGKKKEGLMGEMQPEFVEGCSASGLSQSQAMELWALILRFAKYGFNKSHAAGYSLVAYQTGYLKTHHPAEFMAASMTVRKGNTDEVVLFLEECRRMGIKVLPPCINESEEDFTVTRKGQVRFGLTAIKGVGSAAIHNLLGARDTGGKFNDLFELCGKIDSRILNRKALENLILAGATECLDGHRNQQAQVLDKSMAFGQQLQQDNARGQVSLFGGGDDDESGIGLPHPELPDVPKMTAKDLLAAEHERLGFYFSGHPLLRYRHEADALSMHKVVDLMELQDGTSIRIVGLVNSVKGRQTRNGDMMANAKLEDLTGFIPLLIFPRSYENCKEILKDDEPFLIAGKVKSQQDQVDLIVEEVEPLDTAVKRLIKAIRIRWTYDRDAETMIAFENIVRKHPGGVRIKVHFQNGDGGSWVMTSERYKVSTNQQFLKAAEKLLGEGNLRLETVG
ncbi:DNA polymerase III subunit alpha [bacterium BMS3Bbin04]|nr:DNA polymerase III subunit alpha [bacterium BMS3Bbin04]